MTKNTDRASAPSSAAGTARSGAIRSRLGLSLPAVLGLAALAAVRVPLHDLGIVAPDGATAGLLALVPPAVWVAVVVKRAVAYPVLTLTVVGMAYGVILAVIHQLLWTAAFDGQPPALGGNLTGVLDPSTEALLIRVAAILSSLLTGTLVGAAAGVAGWVIQRVRPR